MKLTFDPKELLPALEFVAGVISPRTVLPVLGDVQVCVSVDGDAKLSATDLDVCLSATFRESHADCWVGDALFPGALLLNACRQLAGAVDEVTLEWNGYKAKLTSGGDSLECVVREADEFPPFPKVSGESFVLPSPALAEALRFVDHTVGTDESRYALCGVHFECGGGAVILVATDGRRISHTSVPASTEAKAESILPANVVPHLVKLCGFGEQVEVTAGKESVEFACGGCAVASKTVQASYPNWRGVLVKEENVVSRHKFGVAELRRAVAWARLAQTPSKAGVKFTAKDGGLIAQGNEQLKATTALAGVKLDATFNNDDLLAACEAFGHGEAEWRFTGEHSQSWLTDGKRHLVLMPMRVS